MCVIIFKPRDTNLPSLDTIAAAGYANPDGFGVCSPSFFYKGMSFNRLLATSRRAERAGEPALLHFRLATHGSVKKSNCHPFYDADTDTYFMHNGVLGLRPVGDKTDSQTAFEDVLCPAIRASGDMCSRAVSKAVDGIIGGSKFAFMHGWQVRLDGDFVWLSDGCAYSNTRFARYLPATAPALYRIG